jgi:hypothetical protein
MTALAYFVNIEAKIGKTPADLRALAQEKGFAVGNTVVPGVKAGQITDWLKTEYGLGHGHAMAVYGMLSGKFDNLLFP